MNRAAILHRLKEETRELHHRLETTPLSQALLSQVPSLEIYIAMLRKLYGFYAPTERALLRLARAGFPLDLEPRRKLPVLRTDLHSLGLSFAAIDGLPICTALPPINSPTAAFGCLYVIEGATLGGQVIVRHLRASLPPLPGHSFAFYGAYGPQTGAMWRAFGDALTSYATVNPAQADAIITAARNTFTAFERWMTA